MDDQKFIKIPCDNPGSISDGYHTFDELYEHRCMLFCLLMKHYKKHAWKAKKHNDGSKFDGWFIAGINLDMPTGIELTVTYHLPDKLWIYLDDIETLVVSPLWDGHTSDDVIERLRMHLELLIRNGGQG